MHEALNTFDCPNTSLISIALTVVHLVVCRWNNLSFQDIQLGEVCSACDTNYSFILYNG